VNLREPYLAVIIAVTLMRRVQVIPYDVVLMIAVRNRVVTASRRVPVAFVVALTTVATRTGARRRVD
jgi:hypothetical protein